MSAHFEKSAKLNGMIKKAAVYPIIVVIVAIAVVIVMLVKVIPSYSEMFNDWEQSFRASQRQLLR